MLIVMEQKATEKQIDTVVAAVQSKGYTAKAISGGDRVSIGVLRNEGAVQRRRF